MTNDGVADWFQSGEGPWMDFGDASELLQQWHPKTAFVKTLPRHALVLDVGAGDGSMENLRRWPAPRRSDLRFYAYAMKTGMWFDRYDRSEEGTWPSQKPDFGGEMFDAIFSAHFIEHIPDPVEFVKWSIKRLKSGGRLYIEWPSENAIKQQSGDTLRAAGVPVIIGNYYDDRTHRKLPDREKIIKAMKSAKLSIDQQGIISNPFIEQEILAQYKLGKADAFSLQAAFWSKTKWAQYVIGTKP